ncbi:MAG: hypothetical protein ACYST2_00890 [Planctomycetota bacterium]
MDKGLHLIITISWALSSSVTTLAVDRAITAKLCIAVYEVQQRLA